MTRLNLFFFVAVPMLASCAQFSEVPQTHSAIEQRLLVRALERSLDRLDTGPITGNAVSVHLSTLAKEHEDFLADFVRARLRERNIRIAEKEDEADQQVLVFAHVLGTDRGGTLIGLPSLPTPVVNVATPEIALYKQAANRGRSETQIFVFDAKSGEYSSKSPVSVGQSKYDNYTVLFFIDFTVEDIGVQGENEGDTQ